MDAPTWGLALLGVGLIIGIIAVPLGGPVSTALYAISLLLLLGAVVLLEIARRR